MVDKDYEHIFHLVLLPLSPCVPCEDRGKGKECKNNQEPKGSIQQFQLPDVDVPMKFTKGVMDNYLSNI